ncbi:MAG: restriction endonuclease [Conexivisphaerales archaeon]
MGRDLESEVSKMNWKEFELLADDIFSSYGMQTIRNYRLNKPRIEVDLIAIDEDFAFCVDCKHWRRTVGEATMLRIGDSQVRRARAVLRKFSSLKRVLPMVLTRYDEQLFVLSSGVPVVPISRLRGFLAEWEGYQDRMLVLER